MRNNRKLIHYIGKDRTKIFSLMSLFTQIGIVMNNKYDQNIFRGYDAGSLIIMTEDFYFSNMTRNLRCQWSYRIEEVNNSLIDATDVEAFAEMVALYCVSRFGSNWVKIYDAYFNSDYNPIENYSMEQVRTPNLLYEGREERNRKTQSDSTTKDAIVPFNDTTPTDTGESSNVSNVIENADNNQTTYTNSEKGAENLTRRGNIGVTTSQQMLSSELELRKFDFEKKVKEDIASILFTDYFGY